MRERGGPPQTFGKRTYTPTAMSDYASRITHEDDGKRGAHFLPPADDGGGERPAEMTYVHAGDARIIVDHTFVDESLRGEGVGQALLKATIAYARDEGYTIHATCPYAKAQLGKHPEWAEGVQVA